MCNTKCLEDRKCKNIAVRIGSIERLAGLKMSFAMLGRWACIHVCENAPSSSAIIKLPLT